MCVFKRNGENLVKIYKKKRALSKLLKQQMGRGLISAVTVRLSSELPALKYV